MTFALELSSLLAGHGRVPAVRNLDLTVKEGEIVALLGPNGAGKTTTLDTACGLLPKLGGDVSTFGQPVKSLRDAAKNRIAYVPEHRGIFRQLTVEENLRLRVRSRKQVKVLLEQFPAIARLRSRRAGLLSGGEQQLLAVMCALSLEARMLLIDEMTMGLSPTVVDSLASVVKDLAASGTAVLFVEQHVHFALEVCDRAYVITQGECVLEGSSADLLARADDLSAVYFGLDALVDGHNGSSGATPSTGTESSAAGQRGRPEV